MSKNALATLAEALVQSIPAGACLDHCMRGIKFAAGLKQEGIAGDVQIVQAVVDGTDAGKPRKILHCWVEVEQSGERMVMDATANHPVSNVDQYYERRNPTNVKRYSPAETHTLLTKAGRAEWFDRTAHEVAQYTGTTTALASSSSRFPNLDEVRIRVAAHGIYERRMQNGELWGTPDGDWHEAIRRLSCEN